MKRTFTTALLMLVPLLLVGWLYDAGHVVCPRQSPRRANGPIKGLRRQESVTAAPFCVRVGQ